MIDTKVLPRHSSRALKPKPLDKSFFANSSTNLLSSISQESLRELANVQSAEVIAGRPENFLEIAAELCLHPIEEFAPAIPPGTWFARQVLGLGEFTKMRTQRMLDGQLGYFPTLPRVTLDWLKRVNPSEGSVIFDIGGGDGMNAAIIALARPDCKVVSIECQFALARAADEMRERMQLKNFEPRVGLAERADYSKGNIFYLYFPFYNDTLCTVLSRIREQTSGCPVKFVSLLIDPNAFRQYSDWLVKEPSLPKRASEYEQYSIYSSK